MKQLSGKKYMLDGILHKLKGVTVFSKLNAILRVIKILLKCNSATLTTSIMPCLLKFLGHYISDYGIKRDPTKMETMMSLNPLVSDSTGK